MKNTKIMRWLKVLVASWLVLVSVPMLAGPAWSDIIKIADIQITKSDSPDPVTAGQSLTYTLIVTNNGPSDAINVTLTDNVSSKIQNPEYSLDSGTTWNSWTSPLNIGNISDGDSKKVLIKGVVDPLATGNITNIASVSSDTFDYNLLNNVAIERTSILTANYGVDVTAPAGQSGNPGTTVTYLFTVENTGNTSDDFTLSLSGNSWISIITSPSSPVTIAAGATQNVSVEVTIPSGAAGGATDTVTLTATGTHGQTDSDSVTTTAVSLYGVDVTAPAGQSGNPGTTVTYLFTVENTGNTSDDFTLSLSGNSWISIITSPSSPVTIAAGATQNVSVEVTIPSGAAGGATDTVTLTATGTHGQTDSDSVTTTAVSPAKLSISKTSSYVSGCYPPLVNAPTIYDLVITVKNTGESTATNVVVTDNIPYPATYSSHSVSKGSLSINSSGDITWLVGKLGKGEKATATIRVTVLITRQMAYDGFSTDGAALNYGATVTGKDEPTGSSLKDGPTDPLYTPPIKEVRFTLSKEGPATVQAGDIITYTISYTNVGTGEAPRVVLEDIVPENTSFVGASAGVYDPDTNTFSFYIGSGPVGMSGFVNFSVLVSSNLPPGTTIISNQARILSYCGDWLVDEAISNTVTTKVIVPFLEIEKSVNLSKAVTGDIILYTIKVKNISEHDTAEDVKVSDTLPFGIMYLSGSTAINGEPADDPEGKQPNYTWTIESIAPESTATITYKCQIGLNATSGYYDNLTNLETSPKTS